MKTKTRSNKRLTTTEFVEKAIAKHNNKYDYSLVNYSGAHEKVDIICKTHGVFSQKAYSHLNGRGCRSCMHDAFGDSKRDSKSTFIDKAIAAHGYRYIYDKVEYTTSKKNVIITCKLHGDFIQKPNAHVQGQGCQECAKIAVADSCRSSKEEFIQRARLVHGDKYSYDNVVYSNAMEKVAIECPSHGVFWQSPSQHLSYGCNKCSHEYISKINRDTRDNFIEKAVEKHGYRYDYSKVDYEKSNIKVKIICPVHGVFEQNPYAHLNGQGCPDCGLCGPSKGEVALSDYITSLIDTKLSDRTLIAPKEIDCLIESKKLGVEFCGVYYHSEKYREKDYHIEKLKLTNAKGYGLIQVFDDEWIEKQSIVKSIIKNRLGLSSRKVHARKTSIQCVSSADSRKFLNDNHLQGSCNAEVRFGLYEGNELVMLATFSSKRKVLGKMGDGWFELVRLCALNDTHVVGGFSKLLKHFIESHQPQGIKTFCDKRYFNGKGYEAVGFVKIHDSPPSYYYVKTVKRFSRFMFQKHKLEEKLKVFDANLTEHENMKANGYSRVYDCGNHVFEMLID